MKMMMRASTKTLTMGLAVVLCMAMAEAITCGLVAQRLAPCLMYLRIGGAVPPPCCSSLMALNNAAKTTLDRQQTCNCLKNAAASIRGLNYGVAAALPGKCRINLPYKLTPSIDCKSVK